MTASAPPDRTGPALAVAREAALGLVSVASILALGRLFTGSDHFAPLLVHVVLAHVVMSACRRRGLHLVLTAVVAAVACAVAVSVVLYPATTTAGVPSTETLEAVTADLDTAWALFGEAPTPTEPITGFLVLSALAVWVTVFVADWAAFRLEVPLEAVLPAATIFVFAAILADDRNRTATTLFAVAAVMTFFLVHRVSRQVTTGRWVTAERTPGVTALLSAGGALTALAVVAATALGPDLPGAGSEPIVELEPSKDRPQSRVTVSPLVDIRRRLVDQATVEVFTVRSDAASYWRLTSLDTFDGRIWSSSGSYGEASGDLPEGPAAPSETTIARQEFSIEALAAIWLPAAYEPRRVESEIDVRYDESTATLIVDTDVTDSDGVTYAVESRLPRFSPEQLLAATGEIPTDVGEANLQLPATMPASVVALAEDVAGAAGTPYEAALALQEFFRTEFEYSLEVPAGHSGNDLERFLLTDRAGYCEQFAGAYAAMARVLGIPARVAVGFTPGRTVEPGRFSVRGENAHAWPEVYLAGAGWVPFEPTPGRGAPGAEAYTGVPEQQEVGGVLTQPDPEASVPDPEPDPGPEAQPDPETGDQGVEAQAPPTTEPAPEDESRPRTWPLSEIPDPVVGPLIGTTALVAIAAAYVVIVLTLLAVRRRSRRRSAQTPADAATMAWEDVLERAGLLGLLDDPARTHRETARILSGLLPEFGDLSFTMAHRAEAALYGPPDLVRDEDPAALWNAADAFVEAIRERTTVGQRLRGSLDPRRSFPQQRRRARADREG